MSELTPQKIAENLDDLAKSIDISSGGLFNSLPKIKSELISSLRSAAADERRIASGELKPVVHAHWIDTDFINSTGEIYECSNCHKFYNPAKKAISLGRQEENPAYCSRCGALMDETRDGNSRNGKDDSNETD
jgi:hypothetical protein